MGSIARRRRAQKEILDTIDSLIKEKIKQFTDFEELLDTIDQRNRIARMFGRPEAGVTLFQGN